VAVTVALVLAGGVMMGMGAIVVDLGWLYVERAQLQSGADAAAVGVSKACGQNTVDCTTPTRARNLADRLADHNSADGAANIGVLCGRDAHQILPSCAEPNGCYGQRPAEPANYVEVVVLTGRPDSSSTLLPPWFAQAMVGSENEGVEVRACARATWSVAPAIVAAMTISGCEYNDATTNGTNLAPRPPYPPDPDPLDEYTIYTRGTQVHANCVTRPAGWQAAGPFAWIDGDAECHTTVPENRVLVRATDPGNVPPAGCGDLLRAARDNRTVIYVIVHDGRRNRGGNTQYRAASLAPFVVTGFFYPDDSAPSWSDPSGDLPCSGTDRCISGFFVGRTVPLTFGGDTAVTIVG
jgi:hypothetical protein